MTETKNISINQIPCPTWNWLKMNDAQIAFGKSQNNPTKWQTRNLADGIIYVANDEVSNATGETATEIKHALERAASMETGSGNFADGIFDGANDSFLFIEKKFDTVKTAKPIVICCNLENEARSIERQIIYAKEGACADVIVVCTSDKEGAGFQALRTFCIAEKNAQINLIKVQLLGAGFVQVDDTAVVCSENTQVSLNQIMLGAKECYASAAVSLCEYAASFCSDAAFWCVAFQKLDMNYVVRHMGAKTCSKMAVRGTLCDGAEKTYRGTIDFVKGCAGSVGEEIEDVLVLSPQAVNKSIPLILCGEEDVSGEHGASIGRMSADVLFYMESRGVSRQVAEKMLARAKVDAVASRIGDEEVQSAIEAFLEAGE